MPNRSALTQARLLLGLFLIGLLVLARSFTGFVAPVPLQVDEAQYLGWATAPAFGYFSKPPFIAWVLGANASVCSLVGTDTIEGCARMSQAFALGFAALFAGLASYRLFQDRRVALVTMALLATSPLFGFYSLYATTDAWLLMWWAIALWAFINATSFGSGQLIFWLICGMAVGFGLLSKYSMGIFVVSAFIWILLDRRLFTIGPWLAALVGFLVFLPNLLWNVETNFPTFSHHLEISQVEQLGKSVWTFGAGLLSLAEFLLSQFVLIGPFALLAILLFLPRHLVTGSAAAGSRLNLLLVFAIPMLALISAQAFSSRAHANWAAPSLVSLAMLAAYLWAAPSRYDLNSRLARIFFWLSIALGLIFSALLIAGPKWLFHAEEAPEVRAIEKLRGWKEAAQWAISTAEKEGLPIVADDRRLLAAISAYAMNRPKDAAPLRLFADDLAGRRNHHYTWFYNIADQKDLAGQKVLVLRVAPQPLSPPAPFSDNPAVAHGTPSQQARYLNAEPLADESIGAISVSDNKARISAYVATVARP